MLTRNQIHEKTSLIISLIMTVLLEQLLGWTHRFSSSLMSCPGGQPHPGPFPVQKTSGSSHVLGQVRFSWYSWPSIGQS